MRLVEHVAGEGAEGLPHGFGFGLGVAAGARAGAEFCAELVDLFRVAILDQAAAKRIGAAPRHTGESVGDEQDVLLIDEQAVGVLERFFERGVRIGDRLQTLVTAGKSALAAFIGRAGADHGFDGGEAFDGAAIGGQQQVVHVGRFDVEDAAGVAGGDHFPGIGVGLIDGFQIDGCGTGLKPLAG